MRSKLAEELRREQYEEMMALLPSERLELAFRLGDIAVESYAATHRISRDEARRVLQRNSRHGRRYSRCIEELDGEPSR